MSSSFRPSVALLLFVLFAANLKAQDYLHQVIVLNEGWSDWQTGEVVEPATLAVYDPGLETYTVVDTIEDAGFVSDALVFDEKIFVAADGSLLKYDANSYELLQSKSILGIRKILKHNDLIYITRGGLDDQGMSLQLDAYFQWYDAESLELVGELTASENGPQFATEGIAVDGDRIYFAINNAFEWGNEVGFLGSYDVQGDEYDEWDLGENGVNPYHLFEVGGAVVSVNNRDYGSTSLSVLNVTDNAIETIEVSEANAGCLAAVAVDSELRYQITGESVVRQTNAQDFSSSTEWISDCSAYYGMAVDAVSGDVYGSVTDYSTFGLMEVRSETGQLISQFDCGVSPCVICMDIRNVSDIASDLQQNALVRSSREQFDVLGRAMPFGPAHGVMIDSRGRKVIALDRN